MSAKANQKESRPAPRRNPRESGGRQGGGAAEKTTRTAAAKGGSARAPGKTGGARGGTISGQEAAAMRLAFYRDGSRYLRWTLIAGVTSLAIGLSGTIFSLFHEGGNRYFAADEQGRVIDLVALSQPNHKDSVIAQWASRALVDTFQFNFDNYRTALNEAVQEYFTSSGGTRLIQELEGNGTLETVAEQQLLVSLIVDEVPIVIDKGRVNGGRYFAWRLQAPATITYRNTRNRTFTNKVTITATVVRRSMLEDPEGLGISSIVITRED